MSQPAPAQPPVAWMRGQLRSALLVTGGLVMGLATAWLFPHHTAVPEQLAGTVTWSNEENRRILFDANDRTRDNGEYSVLAESWVDASGRSHSRGYPSCLAGRPGDPVRTDKRRIEVGVIYLDADGEPSLPIVVSVRCFD